MLRPLLTWLSVLLTTLLLAACCGSVTCECEDAFADAIGFQFSPPPATGPATGFAATAIDTVFLVRVPRDTAQRPRADTVAFARRPDSVYTQPVIINNATPFALASNRKLDDYTYQLYLARRQRKSAPTFTFTIDSVALATKYEADGCCTCYRNTGKQVWTTDQRGNRRQFDLTDPTNGNQLVPIVLTRPQ